MKQDTGAVDRAYLTIKEMVASFEVKPEERLNEVALSSRLAISRTPLREALNRLAAEGFLTFRRGLGFQCRSLNPAEIMDLYEARTAIEAEGARLAARRADPGALAEVQQFLAQSEAAYSPGTSPVELIGLDEEFHRRVVQLANNSELLRLVDNTAARIQYVRVIDLQALSETNGAAAITTRPHARILAAIAAGDEEGAAAEMRGHISRRLEEVTQNVRIAFSRIYAP